ncbi:phage recombination protein Bet [Bradyrhizobium sp. 930_D9_N1_4]|uniref:phage recombination protein Bet n=1 Tax=Bradyrhizobium sp. 930_D9_N1_4 TaxID=3240374 RepID=UPI003F8C69FA
MNQIAHISPSSFWTPRQLATIKQTVASDTNEIEFDLFIEYAGAKRLDPFSKQIIAVVYSKDDPKKRKMTIIVTQDGQRVLASRCRDYRPAETEPEFVYRDELKGPTNPLGIEKCTVKLWKQDNTNAWHPVIGWAYWTDYAPIKTSGDAFEWVDTGETYQDSGKPKKRKQLKAGADISKMQALDDSGNWAKMPRVMLAKCANMVALRSGWPETFDGVYAEEEMEHIQVQDRSASEMVEIEREQRRMKTIAMSDDEYPFVDDTGHLSFIPAGRYADQIIMHARNCTTADELEGMKTRNREGLQRFWARHKDDALAVRKELDTIPAKLTKGAA